MWSLGNARVIRIRCDGAGEKIPNELKLFCKEKGVDIKTSPPCAPQSNGIAKRLEKEHLIRARVLLISSNLPPLLWGETISHANWLRNRTPSSRIDGNITIIQWNSNIAIFKKLLSFGTQGYSFIYRSITIKGKKFLPRSELSHFVGVESDSSLIRVFVQSTQSVKIVRRPDFHPIDRKQLTLFQNFLDGISRQHFI